MKYKKILLFLVVAFCVFFIGANKVEAAHYLVCRYTVPKSANSQFIADFKSGVVYVDGKFSGAFMNNPNKGTNCDDTRWFPLTESEWESAVSNYGSVNWNGDACPDIELQAFLYCNANPDLGNRLNNDDASMAQTKPTVKKVLIANLSDKTCSYKDRTHNKTITATLKYDSSPLYFKADHRWQFNDWPNMDVSFSGDASGTSKKLRWIKVDGKDTADDGKSSTPSRAFDFFSEAKGDCPYYLFYGSKTDESFFSNLPGATGKYNQYSLLCPVANDADFKAMKQFFFSNYDKGTVTATLDQAFASKLVTNLGYYDDWYKSFSESERKVCLADADPDNDDKSLKEASAALCTACLGEENCVNDDVSNACGATGDINDSLNNIITGLKDKLENVFGAGIDFDDFEFDCSIFGDKDDEDSIMYVIVRIFSWIRIMVPVVLVVLGVVDFAKVVVSQDADAMKKAVGRFSKRCVMAILVFFIPTIVTLILTWIDNYIISTDPTCITGNLSYIVNKINIFK